ncbi:MAG: helix-turn-helix transcriptional regulator [Verrucomicrobia bacterium]|nr:helix-turn-helix transcriptional regulator [Verrucomicrobiota bacterium]
MLKRDSTLLSLGLNVRRRREALDLTQEALAEKAGLDQTYISGIERGVRNPGIKNVVRLARALGIPTAKLVEGLD